MVNSVTLIVPYVSKPRYGVSVAVKGLLQGLSRLDCLFSEMDLELNVFSYKQPIDLHLQDSCINSLETYKDLISSIRKSKIVHIPLTRYFPVFLFPYFWDKVLLYHIYGLFHKGLLYTTRSLEKIQSGIYVVLLKLFSRFRNQKYICVSERVKEEVKRYYNISNENLFVVENPVLDEFFDIKKHREGNMLISVGYVSLTKNQELAIYALKKVIDYGINSTLYIVGGIKDIYYYKKLKSLVKKLNLENNVKFLGFVPHRKVLHLYSRADITLVTSLRETFSLSLAESMASGTPVVSTPVGVAPDVIKNKETGFLVTYDAEDVANAVIELLQDSRLWKRISDNSKKIAQERWRAENVAKKVLNVYNFIVDNLKQG